MPQGYQTPADGRSRFNNWRKLKQCLADDPSIFLFHILIQKVSDARVKIEPVFQL